MFFQLGQEVVLKFTGDRGVITEVHSDGMMMVHVKSDDMYIPVYQEDAILASAYIAEKKKTPIQLSPTFEEPSYYIETQYQILRSIGIQLAFEPVFKFDIIDKYLMYLINDTKSDVIFSLKLFVKEKKIIDIDGKSTSLSVFDIGSIFFDELNDSPNLEVECSEISTAGLGEVRKKSFKIKAQQFFKTVITAPLMNKPVHHYVLFDTLEENTDKKEEDLKTYTKKNTIPVKQQKQVSAAIESTPVYRSKNQIQELADFTAEIDLHIENLQKDYAGLSNSQIMIIQLAHFERFMQKAIRLGVDRVFIIHGVGKGKLRDEVTTRLLRQYDIHTFKNEYHPRYGFGATEVIF